MMDDVWTPGITINHTQLFVALPLLRRTAGDVRTARATLLLLPPELMLRVPPIMRYLADATSREGGAAVRRESDTEEASSGGSKATATASTAAGLALLTPTTLLMTADTHDEPRGSPAVTFGASPGPTRRGRATPIVSPSNVAMGGTPLIGGTPSRRGSRASPSQMLLTNPIRK